MSFGQFNKAKLLEVAKYFEVTDVSEDNTKLEIETSIKEAGISWAAFKKFEAEQEEQATSKDSINLFTDSRVLLKMDRQNPSFETHGHTFTKKNPFVVLSADEAQEIIDMYDGFRLATPAEARSFYS